MPKWYAWLGESVRVWNLSLAVQGPFDSGVRPFGSAQGRLSLKVTATKNERAAEVGCPT